MSSVLFVEPLAFGAPKDTARNPLIASNRVAFSQAETDKAQLCALLNDMSNTLENNLLLRTHVVHLNQETKVHKKLYEDKTGAAFVGHALTVHEFTDDKGNIVRRIVVLYPMTAGRRNDLSLRQVLKPLEDAATEEGSVLELVDLRPLEREEKCLEGDGAVVFSADGRFVYMSRSTHTNDEVLDILCSEENLNIPPQNQFLFTSKVAPLAKNEYGEVRADPKRAAPLPHTNVLGWCGRGICAWALDSLVFENEQEEERFFSHLEKEYEVVLELTDAEVRGFVGNAVEVTNPDNERYLLLSETAKAALTAEHRAALTQWYGEKGLVTYYGNVIETRCGATLASCMAVSHTVGTVPPNWEQVPTMELLLPLEAE